MKAGRTLQELATEIERRAEAKKDYIAPIGKVEMRQLTNNGPAHLVVANGVRQAFAINDIAHGQIAEYAGIPMPYYRRMLTEAPALLSNNVNRWLADKGGDRRMVRTLDGAVRAFLSDKYRPLENEDLAEVVLPALLDQNLMVV